jgi:putative sigma-54 modulation protein
MNLTISGHHLEVTPALRSYVTGKLDRITRHFDQVVDVKVLLTVEKLDRQVVNHKNRIMDHHHIAPKRMM